MALTAQARRAIGFKYSSEPTIQQPFIFEHFQPSARSRVSELSEEGGREGGRWWSVPSFPSDRRGEGSLFTPNEDAHSAAGSDPFLQRSVSVAVAAAARFVKPQLDSGRKEGRKEGRKKECSVVA